MDEPSEFLDEVRRACALEDRSRALETARGVFGVLLRAGGEGSCRSVAAHLPEELETVWKPAFFTCLREDASLPDGGREGAFVRQLREEVPALDADDADRAVRSVLRALRHRMDTEGQAELARSLPETLRKTWTSA